MAASRLRIATRESPLALWQARFVRDQLIALHPQLQVELLGIRTEGDRFLSAPLAAAGGKGLFIKELEQALMDERAEIAVHSMKDVPIDLPSGLHIPVILSREDPRDVLVAGNVSSLQALPQGSVIGTSSLRRKSQLRALRPDLQFVDLRGNVGTRLKKLSEGNFQAIILAAAGVKRLGLTDEISAYFAVDEIIPAIGQGAIGIECRSTDNDVNAMIGKLDDPVTHYCVVAERAINEALEGGCHMPIAGHAVAVGDEIVINAMVANEQGTELITDSHRGGFDTAHKTGLELGRRLIDEGADQLLDDLRRRA